MQIFPLPLETVAMRGFTHRINITFADLNTTAATTATKTLFPDGTVDGYYSNGVAIQDAILSQLPAGFTIEKTAYQLITPFLGGAITAMTLGVGDKANAVRYIAGGSTDLFTAIGTNTKDNVTSATTYAFAGSDVAANNAQLTCLFTAVGANLTALTQGSVNIFLACARLDDLANA